VALMVTVIMNLKLYCMGTFGPLHCCVFIGIIDIIGTVLTKNKIYNVLLPVVCMA